MGHSAELRWLPGRIWHGDDGLNPLRSKQECLPVKIHMVEEPEEESSILSLEIEVA